MELKDFKKKEVKENDVIEYTSLNIPYRGGDSVQGKGTRLAYFTELIEEWPEYCPKEYQEGKPKPPFIVVAHEKDHNGCLRLFEDISLEDILYLTLFGKSSLHL